MRQLFTNAIVNLLTIVISSVGFTLSVIAHCVAGMLPFVVRASSNKIVHTSSLTLVAASLPVTSEEASAQPVVSLQLGDAQVNFRTSVITALQRKARKASLSTSTVPTPADTESSVVLASPSPSDEQAPSATTPEGLPEREESPSPVQADTEKEPKSRRSSLTQRIVPQVFRRRQTIPIVQPVAGPSTVSPKQQQPNSRPVTPKSRNTSVSPKLKALSLKFREPEDPADAHGRIPYVANPNGGETFHTGFVNPFKGKKKSPSPSPASTPLKTTFVLPDLHPSSPSPTPASTSPQSPATPPSHRRHRSFAAYITSAIRPARPSHTRSASLHTPSDPPSRPPSPRRRSFGLIGVSPYTSSSASTSSASSRSRRSFSFTSFSSNGESERENMKRTQPYGHPYFAPMPVPVSGSMSRPGSAGRSLKGVGAIPKPIWEGDENDEDGVIRLGGLGLGLDLGEEDSERIGW